jgi:hypothetical protein
MKNHSIFETICRGARLAIFADAFVGARTLTAVAHLRPVESAVFIENLYCPYDRKAIELYSKNDDKRIGSFSTFCESIINDLENKKRCVVVWTSLARAETFIKNYLKETTYKYRLYSSKSTSKEAKELEDVDTNWAKLDLVMYTTSITVGINYNPSEKHFDKLYLYACSRTALPRDIAQSLLRCRKITSNTLIYTVDILPSEPKSYDIDTIKAECKKLRESRKSANLMINWTDMPVWAEDNFALNYREDALKSICYSQTLNDYLLVSGYKVSEKYVESVRIESTKEKPTAFEILLPTESEADTFRKNILAGESNEMERMALHRFGYYKQLKTELKETYDESGITEADKLWEEYYNSENQKSFWNVVNEKHNTTSEFLKYESSKKFTELTDSKVDKRIVLDKVLDVLKMKHSCIGKDKFVIDSELVEQLKPLEEEIVKAFSVKAKSSRKSEFGVSNVIDIIKMVFNNWSSAEIESEAKKKRVDGKETRFYSLIIKPNKIYDCITDKESPFIEHA